MNMRLGRMPRRPSPYADVQIELTRLTFRKLLPTVVLGAIGMVGTSALLAKHYNDPQEWRLTRLIFCICLMRVSTVAAFTKRRSAALTESTASLWGALYGSVTFLYCCTMIASTLYNLHYHDQTGWGLCTIGTFSLCAALGARLGMRPWVVQLCGLLMLGALAFSVVQSEIRAARVGALLILFFAYAHCESVQHKFDIVVEQLRMKRKLRHLAEHDALTSLANRRQFQSSLADACREADSFAVLFIDLDKFKRINDTYGHAIGDMLLQHVADRLRNIIRYPDLLARLGGDEFAILHSPAATEASSQALASRINQAIAAPFAIDGQELRIGASVGIRLSQGDTDPNRLLSKADEALYRVKEAGGGSLCFSI